MSHSAVLILNRGSDVLEALHFRDENGDAVNMTGHQIQIVDAHPWFASAGTVAWTNQAQGEAVLARPWAADAPAETWVRIRTKRTDDDYDDAYPQIVVRFV